MTLRMQEMLQSDRSVFTLALMKKKLGLAIIAVAILSGIAFVPGACADEETSILQAALSLTTSSSGGIAQPVDSSSPLSAENQIFELAMQMAAASHQEAANSGTLSSIFPPTPIDSIVSEAPPVFQSGLESPTSAQPAPEPSPFTFGSLSLGLIALNWLNKRRSQWKTL